jgi:hypothetical protein
MVFALGPPSVAWATACIPGHNTVVLPCTFDGGLLTLDNAVITGQAGAGGNHNTLIEFGGTSFNPTVLFKADVDNGFDPFSSTESTSPISLSFEIGGCGSDPGCPAVVLPGLQIGGLSLTLIDPSGDLTVSLSNGILSITCTATGCTPASGTLSFSPVTEIPNGILAGHSPVPARSPESRSTSPYCRSSPQCRSQARCSYSDRV